MSRNCCIGVTISSLILLLFYASPLKMSTKVEHSVAAVVGPITSPTFVSSGIVNVSDDYTVGAGVGVVRVIGYVPISVVLPTASSNAGRFITVVNVGTGGVVLSGYGGTETVCGMAQLVLAEQNESLTLVCDGGSGWDAVGADVDRLQRWTNFCSLFRFSPALDDQATIPECQHTCLVLQPPQASQSVVIFQVSCGYSDDKQHLRNIRSTMVFVLPNGKIAVLHIPVNKHSCDI